MKKYQVICMSFDGEYQRERPEFETIDDANEYGTDLGSKWFFYPFMFIVSGDTIRQSFYPLEYLKGKQIKTVSAIFANHYSKPETEGMDTEQFIFSM